LCDDNDGGSAGTIHETGEWKAYVSVLYIYIDYTKPH